MDRSRDWCALAMFTGLTATAYGAPGDYVDALGDFIILPEGGATGPTKVAESEPVEKAEDSSVSRIHIDAGLTFASQYFWRGIIQESGGVIVQPSFQIGADLAEWDNGVAMTAVAGVWASFHDRETGATGTDSFVRSWYESDFYAGVGVTYKRYSFDVLYTAYTSPNNAFGHVDELSLSVGFDDSDLMFDGFALSPSITVAFEVGENQADSGLDQGVFLGVGVGPEFSFEEFPLGELTIGVPVQAGFSLDDYYEDGAGDDDAFGYFQVGVSASVDLPAPEGFGEWSVFAGADYVVLGDNTSNMNNGDEEEWVFTFGVSASF